MLNEKGENCILYIGGLGEDVTKQTLHAAFIPFGEIKSVDIPYDTSTSNSYLYNSVIPYS